MKIGDMQLRNKFRSLLHADVFPLFFIVDNGSVASYFRNNIFRGETKHRNS